MIELWRAWRQVMRDGRLDRRALDELVRNRLRSVLIAASDHVPYYRTLMKGAGYDPVREDRGPEDLARLPITRKETLKARSAAFVREGTDLSTCFTDTTSGSTGIPLRVYRSRRERALEIAKWLRVLFANHYSLRSRALALVAPGRVDPRSHLLQRAGILQRRTLDYVHTSVEAMADVLLDYRPHVLYGNRSHLDLLALELRGRGVRPMDLRSVIVAAERLGPHSRQLYRDHFGVEAVESYGSVETGTIAYETPARDGLHVCEDLTYVEFLDADGRPVGPGQPARVIVTDLAGTLMPFIRYDLGDLAVYEHHRDETGATWRRLREVLGRDNDVALLADGRRLPAQTLYKAMSPFEDVLQFRIVQEAPDRFRLVVAADAQYLARHGTAMADAVRQAVPLPATVVMEAVDRLSPDPTGKMRSFVSQIV